MEKNHPDWTTYRPGKDPYMAAKILEGLPLITGERGKFVVGMFSYFRWVDDEVDERTDLTKEQKLWFLDRQMMLADGNVPGSPVPMELLFDQLPWHVVPQTETRESVKVLLNSISDDVTHQGLIVRSDRELTEYSLHTVEPVVNGLFLVLNGKLPGSSDALKELLDAYIRIGSLEGLGDDLQQGVVKVPLESRQGGITTIDEVLNEYDERKFNKMKWDNLLKILCNVGSFAHLNIPAWQKVACMGYLCAEVLVKKPLVVSRKRALKNLR